MTGLLGLPPNHSANGAAIDDTMLIVHILMLILFIGWGAYFVYVLIKFRRAKNEKADYMGVKSKFSKYLEIAVAALEGALLLGFSFPIWAKRVERFPDPKDATVVRLIGEQFAWNVHYPGPDGIFGRTDTSLVSAETNPLGIDRDDPAAKDDIITLNQMHLPVDKPAIIHLSSKDVIHCINLRTMRVKQDLVPGIAIPIWFEPIQTGQTEIACAQLCGLGHYRMKGFLTVETQAEFDAWMEEQAKALEEEGGDEFWD